MGQGRRTLDAAPFSCSATATEGALLRDTRPRDVAHAVLAEIFGWFTEGFDTADLKDAKALLDRLASEY
jgi:hypothetical protein